MRRTAWFLLAIVAALVLAVGGKTLFFTPSKQLAVEPVTPRPVDAQAVASRLAQAVRFRTVSSYADANANAAEFDALQAFLQASFPKAHAALEREAVGGHALLYRWPGSDASAPPIALMAHQDVVPIPPGTEGDWRQRPFSGAIEGGFVWGRGAWDDKGNLMAIMEAVESLAAEGFRPRQTVYLIFGADEEVGGARGAQPIAKLLSERKVHLQFVLDEGLVITDGVLKGLDAPAALVGVAEKGILTAKLTASAAPGHSSMPPPQAGESAIGMLSAALVRVESQPMPGGVRGLPQAMFEAIAPEMHGLNRLLLANLWLTRPLVERELSKSPSTNAMLRTTTALTVVHGGNKENVLPGRAEALVNFRLLPGDTSAAVLEHVKQAVNDARIGITMEGPAAEASRVSRTAAPGYRWIERSLRQLHPDVIVAPGLMIGATDSRHFEGIADDVYRFSPVRARPEDLKRFHGTNERIAIANYVEVIQFYRQLLRNASAANAAATKGPSP